MPDFLGRSVYLTEFEKPDSCINFRRAKRDGADAKPRQ